MCEPVSYFILESQKFKMRLKTRTNAASFQEFIKDITVRIEYIIETNERKKTEENDQQLRIRTHSDEVGGHNRINL